MILLSPSPSFSVSFMSAARDRDRVHHRGLDRAVWSIVILSNRFQCDRYQRAQSVSFAYFWLYFPL